MYKIVFSLWVLFYAEVLFLKKTLGKSNTQFSFTMVCCLGVARLTTSSYLVYDCI